VAHHRRGVAAEAEGLAEAHLGVGDLALAGFAAQLPAELADLEEALGGGRLAERLEPATRVDGQLSGRCRLALLDQSLGLAGLAQAPVFREGQLVVDGVVL
jgi:hypothetical protein